MFYDAGTFYFVGATEGTWHLFISNDIYIYIFVIFLSACFLLHWRIVSRWQFLLLLYSCLKEVSLPSGWRLLIPEQFTKVVIICKWRYQMRISWIKWRLLDLSFVPSTLIDFGFSSVFHFYSNGECMIFEQVSYNFIGNSISM